MSFLEAAALAQARGVPPRKFAAALPGITALLLDHVEDAARRIEEADYAGDQATVDIHLAGSSRRLETFVARGVESAMTAAFVDYCRQAAEVGRRRRGHRRRLQAHRRRAARRTHGVLVDDIANGSTSASLAGVLERSCV